MYEGCDEIDPSAMPSRSRLSKKPLLVVPHTQQETPNAEANLRKPQSPEYHSVAELFMQTCSSTKVIVAIERVQHVGLWQTYAAYRDFSVAPNNDGIDTERLLFRAADRAAIAKIGARIKQCFHQSGSGAAGPDERYGRGLYFARDACYSARAPCCRPDGSDEAQCMYLARVAVGTCVQGTPAMAEPPEREPGTLYDSTVDNVDDPTIFVVFHDAAVYPEYIITFRDASGPRGKVAFNGAAYPTVSALAAAITAASDSAPHPPSLKKCVEDLFGRRETHSAPLASSGLTWHVSRGKMPDQGGQTSETCTLFGSASSAGALELKAVGRHVRRKDGKNVYDLVHWRAADVSPKKVYL